MKKNIRVLQFPVAASKGGVTQYVLNLWKNIDRNKIQFDFVTFSQYLDFESELINSGSRIYHMSCYPEQERQTFINEFNKILNHNYDVIELHTSYWKDIIVEQLAKKCGIKKIIIHAHSSGITANLSNEEIEKATRKHVAVRKQVTDALATDFWACSTKAAQWLFGGNIAVEKIKIIHNAIDVKKFTFNKEVRKKIRQQLNWNDQFIIGNVGRLESVKNHTFIIELFKQVHDKNQNSKLLLVGEGSLRESIEKKIGELDLENDVLLLGKRDDVEKWLQAMDVFILPSFFEGLPIALVEAQCTGLKCIYSDNISDEVKITDNAIQLPIDSMNEWVKRIMEESSGYERRGKDKELTQLGYDISRQIKEIEEMYYF